MAARRRSRRASGPCQACCFLVAGLWMSGCVSTGLPPPTALTSFQFHSGLIGVAVQTKSVPTPTFLPGYCSHRLLPLVYSHIPSHVWPFSPPTGRVWSSIIAGGSPVYSPFGDVKCSLHILGTRFPMSWTRESFTTLCCGFLRIVLR